MKEVFGENWEKQLNFASMVHIKITKGLDIPILGKPQGKIQELALGGEAFSGKTPKTLGLDLKPFETSKLRLLTKAGDFVKTGQPLAEDKESPGRMWASPATGTIREIRRGLKRVLQTIVIDVAEEEIWEIHPAIDLKTSTRDQLIHVLKQAGLFTKIRSRPLDLLADPNVAPKAIFVKALESAPFTPQAEMQVIGHEIAFQLGLDALALLSQGEVHLVYKQDTTLKAFFEAKNVYKHTAEGPHPSSNYSLHIQNIAPIRSLQDIVWTINAHDVVAIGKLLSEGKYFTERVVSIAGPGVLENKTGFFKIREGFPVSALISGRIPKGLLRFVSGDPLTGSKVEGADYLGVNDYVFSVIPENVEREFLHFMGLGWNKYSFSKAYLTGHLDNNHREYFFTTNQHGEHRAFIDSTLSDKVNPLNVPVMPFIKALLAEDFDLSLELGILEVSAEDFALPAFVCPSKMEMVDIVKRALQRYAKDILA